MSKIIVIGANHAGTAAVNTILDHYQDEVIVFDANSDISFLGCGMALWIGKQIENADGLFYSSKEILEKKGAKIHMNCPVESIDFNKKVVYAKDKEGNEYTQNYDKLILATGSKPIIPNVEGTNLSNIQLVKQFQNAQEVIDKLKHDDIKRVVVVGAGYIGVELAEAFKRNGKGVTLIDSATRCLNSYYDKSFTDMMEKNLRNHGIQLALNEQVISFEGKDRVEKVNTNTNSYEADMVVLAVGFKPNASLGSELKRFKNNAYFVNKKQETSIQDVYAIGDCATIFDNATQTDAYIALATNAVRSGIIAGHNACGTKLEGIGVQGSNGICIYDLKMVSSGLTFSKAKQLNFNAAITSFEDLQKPAFIKDNEKVKIEIVYDQDTRRILGAQIASFYDMSMAIHMFSLAIQECVSIDKLKLLDLFFLPHFNQPYNYITMAALQAK